MKTEILEEKCSTNPTKRFEELHVWKNAHSLVISVYKYSNKMPRTEIYALTQQLRRAIVSVPANIAEGYKKKSKLDKMRFFNIAQASLEECRYYFLLARDLNYGNISQLMKEATIVSKQLEAYRKAIQNSLPQ